MLFTLHKTPSRIAERNAPPAVASGLCTLAVTSVPQGPRPSHMLSPETRLLLLNQYRLLALLDEPASRERWKRSAVIIERDYPTKHLTDFALMDGHPDSLTEDEILLVQTILEIWQILGDAEAKWPSFECGPFPGFGPRESRLGAYADLLLAEEDFSGIRHANRNATTVSTANHVGRYRRQIACWQMIARKSQPSLIELTAVRDA